MDTIDARSKSARKATYSLCGLEGVGPEVALLEYDTYIIRTMLYGLEALVLDEDINTLEEFH